MKRTKKISIYTEPELKDKLEALSEKHRRSMNQQILIMLEDWFRIKCNLDETGGKLTPEAIENLMRNLSSVGRQKIRPSRVKKNSFAHSIVV